MSLDYSAVEKHCRRIISNGDLNELTQKVIRKKVEELMDLDAGTLSLDEHKDKIKAVVKQILSEDPVESSDAEDDKDDIKSKDDESCQDSQAESPSETDVKSSTKFDEQEENDKDEDEEDAEEEEEDDDDDFVNDTKSKIRSKLSPPEKKEPQPRNPKSKKRKLEDHISDQSTQNSPTKVKSEKEPSEINQNYDSDLSSLIDEEPTPKSKRSKKQGDQDKMTGATSSRKSRKSGGEKKVSDKNSVTIANLKSYINKCGVRKVWSKVLAGMNAPEQIRHLKKFLEDLGMEGRPNLEKCKKIKAKRELQAEIDCMDTRNIIGSINEKRPTLREKQPFRANRRKAVVEDDDDSDVEDDLPKKKGTNIIEDEDKDTDSGVSRSPDSENDKSDFKESDEE
ncbi:hypothetical protein H4219_001252 [Mycoemilia scoparia]|uniref:DEK-C domain-containing protein n=1 Tax=Mycoemilia scoparia TaxID=417184 RepID=A0A9W8A0Q1_9FUNG|nr:hypothetical protein H4219_001252 [Mycoemilia scoparia]